MTEILTELIGERNYPLTPHEVHQTYNGLDAAITLEVFNVLQQYRGDPSRELMYNFTRAMQGPALELMLRGIRIDPHHKRNAISRLEKQAVLVQEILDEFAQALWDKGLNPNSYKQLRSLFYETMKLPPQHKYDKGEKKISTDREALEKLSVYFHAEPLVNCILKLRDLLKKVSVLRTEIDSDGRLRTSYNVAGTETGRWSSSSNVYGGGTNLQNITEELRRMFVADPGKKLAYIDLAQAESRALGFISHSLFGVSTYLDACESGDLHTYTARLVWPDMPWVGDLVKDKALAEKNFYRHFSFRDATKRLGHGTNYYGTAWTMSQRTKIHLPLVENFREQYFTAFPEIPRYHKHIAKELQLHGQISTPLGTGRIFFGRLNDDSTLREAIAYVPQHMVGVLLNLALWRVWYYCREVEILAQVHDAILIQYEEGKEQEVLKKVLPLMATTLEHKGRKMTIPSDITVGWNWAKFYDEAKAKKDAEQGRKPKPLNPDGLRELRLGTPDKRTRFEDPEAVGLDRVMSGIYK